MRAACARDQSHFAWRGANKNVRDIVSNFGHQNELQHAAAHCCTYVYLQAITQLTPRTVKLNARGKRARLITFRMARRYEHGHDIVYTLAPQSELQHNAAHFLTYVYLQATAQLTQSTVRFNARGMRARPITFRMARR